MLGLFFGQITYFGLFFIFSCLFLQNNLASLLAIFIRGVDETFSVTEEFFGLVPVMDTTTANDIFNSFVGVLNRVGVDWSRAVSIATDSAPSMIGKKAGVATKFREVQVVSGGLELWTFHCISQREALCCKSLNMDHVMQVVDRTVNFVRARGLNHRQLTVFSVIRHFFKFTWGNWKLYVLTIIFR